MTPATFKSCCDLIALDGKPLTDPELAIAFCCTWRMDPALKAGSRQISPSIRNHLPMPSATASWPRPPKRSANGARRTGGGRHDTARAGLHPPPPWPTNRRPPTRTPCIRMVLDTDIPWAKDWKEGYPLPDVACIIAALYRQPQIHGCHRRAGPAPHQCRHPRHHAPDPPLYRAVNRAARRSGKPKKP